MRNAVVLVVLVLAAACPPAQRDRCLVDDDCGSGRTPFCVDGSCAECVRNADCGAGLTCSRAGLCLAGEGEGSAEGEGAVGEGEGAIGEGEGAVGEGEG